MTRDAIAQGMQSPMTGAHERTTDRDAASEVPWS
jgi:hypothetical protein